MSRFFSAVVLSLLLLNQSLADDCIGGCYVFTPGTSSCVFVGVETFCVGGCNILQPDRCNLANMQFQNNEEMEDYTWQNYRVAEASETGYEPDFCDTFTCFWFANCNCMLVMGQPTCFTNLQTNMAEEVTVPTLDINSFCTGIEDP